MQVFQVFFVGIVVLYTCVAVFSDLRTRRIPNWLTVPTLALALAAHACYGGLAGLGFSLLGFAAGFSVLFALWLFGGGGGGDVKMMGALGAWLGAGLTIQVFLISAAVTLILSLAVAFWAFLSRGFLAARRQYLADVSSQAEPSGGGKTPRRKARRRGLLPYAVPVAVSTWIVLGIAWRAGTLP